MPNYLFIKLLFQSTSLDDTKNALQAASELLVVGTGTKVCSKLIQILERYFVIKNF